mgnify:CR=1 FL=1
MNASSDRAVQDKFSSLVPILDERARRLWAAAEAKALGRGGVSAVARATGLSRTTIHRGLSELETAASGRSPAEGRVRAPGGGRKPVTETDPTLLSDLEQLVEPTTRGDPESPLRWTCKSVRQLAEALGEAGHRIGRQKVAELLQDPLGYSLQANRKVREGGRHPDRDAQFIHINEKAMDFQRRGQPVISVDTKKKELVGDFRNGGREYRPKGCPEPVRVYDFVDATLGKVNPYGVYDVAGNVGWVSVGTDHDTAEFAVESIRRWYRRMGRPRYPDATELLITADGGGSNGHRVRLWKTALQALADEIGLRIHVCHFPPGTSKWNKIEHRMFSHITMNWRGRPLVSHEVIVNLISATTTAAGLKIAAEIDEGVYPKGVKVTDEQLAEVRLTRDEFHGEWNYRISPKCTC